MKMQRRVELLQHFRLRPLRSVIGLPSLRPRLLWPIRGGRLLGRCGGRGRSFLQNLQDEAGRDGGGENGAISGLFDFKAVEEYLYIRIRTLCADAAFRGVKDAEKGGGFFGDGLRVRLTVGERFGSQVESAEISSRNYRDRRLRKQEAPAAQSAQRTHFGGLHAQNRKTQAGQRNLPVELSQQPRSAKRRRQFAGAVEHATNHVG